MLREHASHRPAELAPLEREHHRPAARGRRSTRSTNAAASAPTVHRLGRARRGGCGRRRRIEAVVAASSARSPAPPPSCRPACPRTAACSGSARRCPAACTAPSSRRARRRIPAARPASVAPRGNADEDAFLARELARQPHRLAAIHRHTRSTSFCATASSVSFGMKSGLQPCIRCGRKFGWLAAGEPSASARLRDAAAEHLRIVRLAHDHLGVRARLRAARAPTPFSVPPVPKPVTK